MQLKDLKIIVTGGAQGMGAHFATRLLEAGAQVKFIIECDYFTGRTIDVDGGFGF